MALKNTIISGDILLSVKVAKSSLVAVEESISIKNGGREVINCFITPKQDINMVIELLSTLKHLEYFLILFNLACSTVISS